MKTKTQGSAAIAYRCGMQVSCMQRPAHISHSTIAIHYYYEKQWNATLYGFRRCEAGTILGSAVRVSEDRWLYLRSPHTLAIPGRRLI